MSFIEAVPGMASGSTVRNVAIAVLYLVLLPLVVIALPFYVLYAVGTNRNGLADTIAGSPLGRLPGLGSTGWKAGGAAFIYVLVAFLVLGAALPSGGGTGGTGPTDADTAMNGGSTPTPEAAAAGQASTPTATPTVTPAATAEPTPTATPTPEPTPTPTSTPVPAQDGESYEFSGTGNDVTDSFTTQGGLVVLDFGHDGSSNFQVYAVNPAGGEELLVNHIGNYDGQVALYLPGDEYRLDVTADGSWNADVTQPRFNQNNIESLPAEADGEYAAWFGPFEFEGSTEVTFEITNDAQASVWLATHEGEKVDLLHNEIGPYEGSALITDSGVGLIVVDTDSAEWRIEIG